MKLCPLFETLRDTLWCHIPTLENVQRELPRDAIELAIDEMQYSADATFSVARQKYLMAAIEQLEALLPKLAI
jgi:hypothetical protein